LAPFKDKGWTHLGWRVRSKLLSLRKEEFILSARLAGCSDTRIMFLYYENWGTNDPRVHLMRIFTQGGKVHFEREYIEHLYDELESGVFFSSANVLNQFLFKLRVDLRFFIFRQPVF